MGSQVAITGMGIVSAIGMNVKENFSSLIAGNHGLTRIDNITTQLRDSIFVGEIKKTNEELEEMLGLPTLNHFSRTAMLGTLAVKEVLESAKIDSKEYASLGMINATTVGSMDRIESHFLTFLEETDKQRYIEVYDAGRNSQLITDYFGFENFSTTISTACSSAANAMMLGARLIKSGRLQKVIVGGMDALSKFTINGFNSLMILSDEFNQPFDENRKGLNLGEAGAYLLLESEDSFQQRGIEPLAYLDGYGNANDAFHQTASSEEGIGAYLAMKKALEMAQLQPEHVDYVNVHGTATPNNDLSEGRALMRMFGEIVPPFSSTKPFTGHTLAAAGAVEAIFSVLALRNQVIFANLNHQQKMKEFDLTPNLNVRHEAISTVLSNSFGFGGNCSSIVLSNQKKS